MEKHKAIPDGYMTVGQLAKKMGVTVRTLQHYDREGFFTPSAESEGGRRLYTDKDLIRLYQILSLKHLGFSLDDIKSKVISLDDPAEVAKILTEQATAIQKKIHNLSQSYEEIELLKAEVLQMQSVNFKTYADIIVNLQMKNEYYWLIKNFDEQTLDHIRNRFTVKSGTAFMDNFSLICGKLLDLKTKNVPPDSEVTQSLAKEFWEMVMEITSKDMSILPKLIEFGNNINENGNEWEQRQVLVNEYVGKALDIYFEKQGVNPLAEELK